MRKFEISRPMSTGLCAYRYNKKLSKNKTIKLIKKLQPYMSFSFIRRCYNTLQRF